MKALKVAAGIILAPVLLVVLVIFCAAAGGASATDCIPGATSTASPIDLSSVPDGLAGYDKDQLTIAATIITTGQSLGVSSRGQGITVMAAMGESSLRNLEHGDEGDGVTNPDGSATCSLGILQQQWCLPGQPWGTRDQVLDPVHAATEFYTRMQGVEGWESMGPALVAHLIQGNENPYYYEPFWAPAQTIVETLSKLPAGTLSTSSCAGTASGNVVAPLHAESWDITDVFGYRGDVGAGTNPYHAGLDLADIPGGSCGVPVFSIAAGTVARAENGDLEVTVSDGGYTLIYMHMPASSYTVKIGDPVTPDQQLGVVGSEGQSTGCHLHIGVYVVGNTNPVVSDIPVSTDRPGYVDPQAYFQAFGITICPPEKCRTV